MLADAAGEISAIDWATINLGKYLGMPIFHGRTSKQTFGFVIHKVRDKMTAWKARLMSKAARRILIQSVSSAIPYYVMQTVRLPVNVVDEVERINRQFFWGDDSGKRKMHTVAWENICLPKEQGGLGLRRLRDMNMALLAKLGWRLLTEPDKLWTQTLTAKYGSPLDETKKWHQASMGD